MTENIALELAILQDQTCMKYIHINEISNVMLYSLSCIFLQISD